MLNSYLKNARLVTGQLLKNTSSSALERIKNSLCGKKQFSGGEVFLNFGVSIHQQLLENKDTCKVSEQEAEAIVEILKKLREHPVVKKLLVGSTKEIKDYSKLNGVSVAYILDIKKNAEGADLKTTACTTLQQCYVAAKKYGYFRQGVTYMKCARLKSFYFIFVQKTAPYNIFIMDTKHYTEDMNYAERELEFLLYFFKHYGNTVL